MERAVSIFTDERGNKIAVIKHIVFKGKRDMNWKAVEQYLKRYVGNCYTVEAASDIIYIGADFPDEYATCMI